MIYRNIFIYLFLLLCLPGIAFCANTKVSKPKDLDNALKAIEKRYQKASFSADFFQESTLKAMDMTDIAEGHALFKWPGMMHWTYEKPEKQLIITNGNDLWIYRPADHQVMLGKSPDYFGKGKGGSFLTDISLLRSSFDISWADEKDIMSNKIKAPNKLILLLPHKTVPDFKKLYLVFNPKTGDIKELITLNAYDDKTRIQFKNVKFDKKITDDSFSFKIPDGADVVQLEQ